ncbi:hypothetical protein L7F22_039825 [Adiantum nelumboides]|nr:hypothetical protein [Adiantum nelumboides]
MPTFMSLRWLHNDFRQLLPEYEQSKQMVNGFKRYVLLKVLAACRWIGMGVKVVTAMWFVNRYELRYQSIMQVAFAKDGYFDFEHLVVSWHVANTVSELPTTSTVGSMQLNEQEDMQMSKLLSIYLMYLMVHKAELLPCHTDIARQLVADTQRDVRQHTKLSWMWKPLQPFWSRVV